MRIQSKEEIQILSEQFGRRGIREEEIRARKSIRAKRENGDLKRRRRRVEGREETERIGGGVHRREGGWNTRLRWKGGGRVKGRGMQIQMKWSEGKRDADTDGVK